MNLSSESTRTCPTDLALRSYDPRLLAAAVRYFCETAFDVGMAGMVLTSCLTLYVADRWGGRAGAVTLAVGSILTALISQAVLNGGCFYQCCQP